MRRWTATGLPHAALTLAVCGAGCLSPAKIEPPASSAPASGEPWVPARTVWLDPSGREVGKGPTGVAVRPVAPPAQSVPASPVSPVSPVSPAIVPVAAAEPVQPRAVPLPPAPPDPPPPVPVLQLGAPPVRGEAPRASQNTSQPASPVGAEKSSPTPSGKAKE